ncbi:MAG: hypothetical protein ACTSRP_03620 [Candidatus Helarchaeota archaeon]
MIDEEEARKKLIDDLYRKNILYDPIITEAFEKVSMKNFFPEEVWDYLYQDMPIPFCFYPQRPCAAPHMNAIFLHLINLDVNSNVLQVSSMSGYFAQLMAEISYKGSITIIEDHDVIAKITKENLSKNNSSRIKVILGDPADEIFNHLDADRIIFCGAISNSFLSEVAEKVKDGTIIIAPVFSSAIFPIDQDLVRIIKEDGEIITESYGKVNFILLESKKLMNWTMKTQRLIFDQIAGTLEEYFQESYPSQEPIFRLGVNTPEFIRQELLDASNLLNKKYYKQVILNCLELLNTTIRYLYKKNIDKDADFTNLEMDHMINELEKKGIINDYNRKNLNAIIDTKEALSYDPESPPNFENIAKNILNQLIWFIEYIFSNFFLNLYFLLN